MLGISTSWKSEILDSGQEIMEAVLDLGLEAAELEYRITPAMLEEILPFLQKRRISVTSLHNVFPLPEFIPKEKAASGWGSLSSLDKEEREQGVRYSLRTLEWAQELEARAVVLHLGKVSMDGPMKVLKKLYDENRMRTEEGKALVEEKKRIRQESSARFFEAALRSLERLAREAERRHLLLGVENRYGLQDIPNREEFQIIFQEFRGAPVGYWHDIGHATTQKNLGIEDASRLLESFGHLLIGVHLHGCRGYNDHYAPGTGEEDYSLLKKSLRPDTVRVIEAHHRTSREDLLRGIQFLHEQGIA